LLLAITTLPTGKLLIAPIFLPYSESLKATLEFILRRVRIDLDAIDFEGQAVIHLAVAGGNVTLVKMLIDRGVDYTKLDACGKSPLEIALAHGHDPLVDMLETRTGVDTSQLQSQKLRYIQQVLAYEKELILRLIVLGDFASRLHGRTIEEKLLDAAARWTASGMDEKLGRIRLA
jgi:hypothetical protein